MTRRSRIRVHGRGPGPSTFLSRPTRTTLFTSMHATRRITDWPISSRVLAKRRSKRNEIDSYLDLVSAGRGGTGLGASLIHGGVRREEGGETARNRDPDGMGES